MQVNVAAAAITSQTPSFEVTSRPPMNLRRTSSVARKPVPQLDAAEGGRKRRHSSVDGAAELAPPAAKRYTLAAVDPSPVASQRASVVVASAPTTPARSASPDAGRRPSNQLLLNVPVARKSVLRRAWSAVVRTVTGKGGK